MLRRGSLVSRLLAVTLLVLALGAALQLVVVPLVAAYRTTAEQIQNAQALLERYRGLAALRPELVERLEEQRQRSEESTAFIEGGTDALASAALQAQAGGIIDVAGGDLRSAQTLPTKDAEGSPGIRRAGLRLQFSTTVEGLERVLYELETAEPYLFIDEITIREQRNRRRRRDQAPAEPALDVTLQIHGYVAPGELPGRPAADA